jgi:hypothetical protein
MTKPATCADCVSRPCTARRPCPYGLSGLKHPPPAKKDPVPQPMSKDEARVLTATFKDRIKDWKCREHPDFVAAGCQRCIVRLSWQQALDKLETTLHLERHAP